MIVKAFLVVALIVLSQANVVVLDDSNYTSFIQEHPYVFVQYYAPWCGHCKAMIPDYEKLAEEAKTKEYVVAKVDATEAKKVAEDVGIDGYPTIKLIVKGYAIDYNGERSFNFMQDWLDTTMRAEILKIDEEKLKELIGSKDFLLIQGASADQLDLLRFGQSNLVDFYALEGGDLKITLHLQDTKTLEYGGKLDLGELSQWVTSNTMSSLVAMSNNNAVKYIFESKNKLPAFMLLRNKDWSDELSEVLSEFCELNKEKLMCGWAGEGHQIYQGVSRFLKVTGDENSALAYFDYGIKNGWKVPEPTSITKQSLGQFLVDLEAGKLEKFHDEEKEKEQAQGEKQPPKKIEFKHVLELTEETYNETIKNNPFVFVEYYSPTCGHCVQFAPDYDLFAEKMKSQESKYVIAAVDMAGNKDINDYVSVNGYPTLRFYVNGHQFDYEGERDGEKIKEWMDKVVDSRLPKAKSIESIKKPAVAVFGIADDSPLQRLDMKFNKYPIYSLEGQSFKVEVHDGKYAQYSGDQHLDAVFNWLEEKTEEVLVKVAEPTTSRKLNRALESQTPILLLVNRDDSDGEQIAREFLTSFCEDKLEYICGLAEKGDKEYKSFNDWIDDPIKEKSRIVYLTTDKFEKYLYEGELADVNSEKITEFIQLIKDGKITAHAAVVSDFETGSLNEDDISKASGEKTPVQQEEKADKPAEEPLDVGEAPVEL